MPVNSANSSSTGRVCGDESQSMKGKLPSPYAAKKCWSSSSTSIETDEDSDDNVSFFSASGNDLEWIPHVCQEDSDDEATRVGSTIPTTVYMDHQTLRSGADGVGELQEALENILFGHETLTPRSAEDGNDGETNRYDWEGLNDDGEHGDGNDIVRDARKMAEKLIRTSVCNLGFLHAACLTGFPVIYQATQESPGISYKVLSHNPEPRTRLGLWPNLLVRATEALYGNELIVAENLNEFTCSYQRKDKGFIQCCDFLPTKTEAIYELLVGGRELFLFVLIERNR